MHAWAFHPQAKAVIQACSQPACLAVFGRLLLCHPTRGLGGVEPSGYYVTSCDYEAHIYFCCKYVLHDLEHDNSTQLSVLYTRPIPASLRATDTDIHSDLILLLISPEVKGRELNHLEGLVLSKPERMVRRHLAQARGPMQEHTAQCSNVYHRYIWAMKNRSSLWKNTKVGVGPGAMRVYMHK